MRRDSFSALQRAEIAEMLLVINVPNHVENVSVLFNEPKLLKCRLGIGKPVRHDRVSVLFNEPKLLKLTPNVSAVHHCFRFSALQRAEIAEMREAQSFYHLHLTVSVLFNEPKLLKFAD